MDIALDGLAFVLGLLTNLIGALKSASASAGGAVHPWRWVRKRPYRTACGVIGGLTGFVVLLSTGQLTTVSAFAAGYMGQDVPEKVAQAADNKYGGAG